MTVTELIELLTDTADIDPTTEVRVATQPPYALECAVSSRTVNSADDLISPDHAVLWLSLGDALGCLPSQVAEQFNW